MDAMRGKWMTSFQIRLSIVGKNTKDVKIAQEQVKEELEQPPAAE